MLFYTVYKTTKTDDGRFYIGVHKTTNPLDGYLGSGIHLRAAVKKYGRSAFKKEVLFVFETAKEAYDKEKELVSQHLLNNPLVFNKTTGGSGGDVDWSKKQRRILEGKDHPQWGKKRSEEAKKSTSETLKRTWATNNAKLLAGVAKGAEKRRGTPSPLKGVPQTEESNAKRSLAHKNLSKKQCPHCQRWISPQNLVVHHGDRCKMRVHSE